MRFKTNFIKILTILVICLILNYIFVLISYKANEFNLEQFAYIMFIFFPISAFIVGILSEVLLRKLWYAPIIVCIAFTISVIAKYNFNFIIFIYILAYAVISIIGFYAAFGVRMLARK